jgi:hypothetical protein
MDVDKVVEYLGGFAPVYNARIDNEHKPFRIVLQLGEVYDKNAKDHISAIPRTYIDDKVLVLKPSHAPERVPKPPRNMDIEIPDPSSINKKQWKRIAMDWDKLRKDATKGGKTVEISIVKISPKD